LEFGRFDDGLELPYDLSCHGAVRVFRFVSFCVFAPRVEEIIYTDYIFIYFRKNVGAVVVVSFLYGFISNACKSTSPLSPQT
jgi:hypothetical protein